MGRIGVLMGFLGVPLVNGGSGRGFCGFWGVYGGRIGVLMGFWGFTGVGGGRGGRGPGMGFLVGFFKGLVGRR